MGGEGRSSSGPSWTLPLQPRSRPCLHLQESSSSYQRRPPCGPGWPHDRGPGAPGPDYELAYAGLLWVTMGTSLSSCEKGEGVFSASC